MYVHSGFEIPLFRVQRRRRGRQHTLELLYAAINSILSYMLKKKKIRTARYEDTCNSPVRSPLMHSISAPPESLSLGLCYDNAVKNFSLYLMKERSAPFSVAVPNQRTTRGLAAYKHGPWLLAFLSNPESCNMTYSQA